MATQDPTTNFSWDLPNVSGDTGNWGTLLNTILGDDATGIDKVLFDVQTTANAALAKAGGTMTGHLSMLTSDSAGSTISSGSGTKTIDLAVANFWASSGNLSGAVILDIVNVNAASGDFEAIILQLSNPGAASSISFYYEGSPENILWQDGADPTWTAAGIDVIVLYTPNAGATWYGAVSIQDPS
jgi:hypothetical protein